MEYLSQCCSTLVVDDFKDMILIQLLSLGEQR